MAQASLDKVQLTPEEQRASDAIIEVMAAIRDLYGGRNPYNFIEEAIPAIHKLQHFVLQHWAYRIHPDYWSNWTVEPGDMILFPRSSPQTTIN